MRVHVAEVPRRERPRAETIVIDVLYEDDYLAVFEAQPHTPDSVRMQDPTAVRRESRLRAQVSPVSAAPPQNSPRHAAGRYCHPQITGLVLCDCLDHRSASDTWDIHVRKRPVILLRQLEATPEPDLAGWTCVQG